MALPSSGAISLNDVNVELGNSATAQIDMGGAAVRGLFGVASGAISMSDGYGKSSQFEFSITSNTNDANLRSLAVSAGWNESSKVVATINSGVYVSSSSTGSAALVIDGSWPGGVELYNYGIIAGRGGAGGRSAGGSSPFFSTSGSAGGGALSVSSSVTIYNNNIIAGGGGGGGGGGTVNYSGYECGGTSSGGGGGGGRSNINYYAAGGSIGNRYFGNFGNVGGTGTHNGAGAGGNGGVVNNCNSSSAGNGGAGGGWGSGGGSGNSGSTGNGYVNDNGSGGGSAGYAVSGNGNITWGATGTRYGAIS